MEMRFIIFFINLMNPGEEKKCTFNARITAFIDATDSTHLQMIVNHCLLSFSNLSFISILK